MSDTNMKDGQTVLQTVLQTLFPREKCTCKCNCEFYIEDEPMCIERKTCFLCRCGEHS